MAHSDPAPPVARTHGRADGRLRGHAAAGERTSPPGTRRPQSVVNGWLNSPGHRANIENASYTSIGSGAAAGASGQIYWAHTFATSGGSAAAAATSASAASASPASAATASAATPPPPPPPTTPPPHDAAAPRFTGAARHPEAAGSVAGVPRSRRRAGAKTASAASPISLRGLTLTPRRPAAGRVLGSKVIVLKQGARLKKGHVFCSARFQGRRLKVLARELRKGSADCAWRVPVAARGKTVSAIVIVQQGRLRAEAPFRANIS